MTINMTIITTIIIATQLVVMLKELTFFYQYEHGQTCVFQFV